jgi:biotin carboxyl carrier protein
MKLTARVGDEEHEVLVEAIDDEPGAGERFRIVIDGVERVVEARRVAPGTLALHAGDEVTVADIDPGKNGQLLVEVHGVTIPVTLVDPRNKLLDRIPVARAAAAKPSTIHSPMPGKVVKVLCAVGDEVAAGQGLVVIEAMKMENELRAPRAAKVKTVHVKEGQAVEGQETLITLE